MKISEFINNQNNLKEYSGPLSDVEYAWEEAADDYEDRYGKGSWDMLDPDTQELYYRKKLQKYGWGVKDGKLYQLESKESLKALARHIKEGVPLVDSLFRYQSEAYFDTFKTAKKLREAGSLPELDWESEEMLGTDIGESVVLKNGERVWLDVPYLEEAVEEAQEGMIGKPDAYYDEEERRQAYNDLQDALAQSSNVEAEYVKDGHCPECPNVEDDEDCYGFGNYGCDDGILTYNNDDVSWKEIQDHDERQAQRQSAKDNYPGDEEVIKGLANMMKNMDDPRQAYQQMQADYPHMGRAHRSSLIAKAKQMAFPESVEIDQIKKLAGLNELDDKRTDIDKIADLLKDAIGPENSGGDMYELYAELESIDSQKADEIKLIAKEIYGVRLEEGITTKHSYDPISGGGQSSKRKNLHATGDIVSLDGKEYVVTKVDLDKGTVDVVDRDGKRSPNVKAGVFSPGIKVGDKKSPTIGNFASDNRDPRLFDGKSPHKKGSAKYKKHMAAMHAEAVRGRPKIDGEATEIQKVEIGGVEREFIRKGEMWHSTDPKYPMKYGYQTPMGQKIAKGRKKDLAKSTPSYQAKLKKNKVMASEAVNEAEYNGKDVKLNKPTRQSGGGKKYKVYVKNPKTGRVKKISFGDAGLKTKSGNKKRAKSFAARHNCEKKNDKMKAGYWACRLPRYGLVKGGKWW
jgi:hypothetical protein